MELWSDTHTCLLTSFIKKFNLGQEALQYFKSKKNKKTKKQKTKNKKQKTKTKQKNRKSVIDPFPETVVQDA